MRYRKKPIEIDAEQFNAKDQRLHPHVHRAVIVDGRVETTLARDERFHPSIGRYAGYAIKSKNGWIEIRDGDWIITEMDGSGHYPCSNEVFSRTYEAAF